MTRTLQGTPSGRKWPSEICSGKGDGTHMVGMGPAALEDFDESDADAEDLQGTIECFLDWNRATQKSILGGNKEKGDKAKGGGSGEEAKEANEAKEDDGNAAATAGILLVGSIGGLTSTAELKSAPF
mmetsp:Transcript_5987/g.12644  ORF Transcript_5987/g.12644 Transcript_5987/m.12644 type:complete len:127 (+) Transcript_5987:1314-1694(+)